MIMTVTDVLTPAHLPEKQPSTVAVVTLGCARNDVDSEELAGRLESAGFAVVDDPQDAETVLVNTCGFVEQAKKDSVDTLLAAADLKVGSGTTRSVVAVGCLAQRYGKELAASLPEADAVLSFDDYPDIAERLHDVLAGIEHVAHTPADRRKLLPISPVERADSALLVPGHQIAAPDLPDDVVPASGPTLARKRLNTGPVAALKLASGCDRRCSFCAIPAFRGAFVSRRPADVLSDARWLAERGARELFCVSENSTSYGKDLGDLRLLETLLPQIAAVENVARVRLSYLQPAEMRPGLMDVLTSTPGVAPYFDLSFQHASGPLLRRMRRFGDAEQFLQLITAIRDRAPHAGVRSNVIVGFPGETEDDLAVLCDFLAAAELDAVGVFGYSDEDGTEALRLDGKVDADTVRDRVERVSSLVETLTDARAQARIGEEIEILLEDVTDGAGEGRAAHQGPEVDGTTSVAGLPAEARSGQVWRARVMGSTGVDLLAEPLDVVR
jgi:ribosomal protein S12 methylthiotransferase RimO